MKNLNAYICYLDDGKDAYRIIVPAVNEKDARQYVAGNGEIIAVKKYDELRLYAEHVANALTKAGWEQNAIDLITRTLQRVGICH